MKSPEQHRANLQGREQFRPTLEAYDEFRNQLRIYLHQIIRDIHSHDRLFEVEDFVFAELSRLNTTLQQTTRTHDLIEFMKLCDSVD